MSSSRTMSDKQKRKLSNYLSNMPNEKKKLLRNPTSEAPAPLKDMFPTIDRDFERENVDKRLVSRLSSKEFVVKHYQMNVISDSGVSEMFDLSRVLNKYENMEQFFKLRLVKETCFYVLLVSSAVFSRRKCELVFEREDFLDVFESFEEMDQARIERAVQFFFPKRFEKLKNGVNFVYNLDEMEHFDAFLRFFEESSLVLNDFIEKDDRFRGFQSSISPIQSPRRNNNGSKGFTRFFICACTRRKNQNHRDNNRTILSRSESLSEAQSRSSKRKFFSNLLESDISEVKSHQIIMMLTLMIMYHEGNHFHVDEFPFVQIQQGVKWSFEMQDVNKFKHPSSDSWALVDIISSFFCVSPIYSRIICLSVILGNLSSHSTFWSAVNPLVEYLNSNTKVMTKFEIQTYDFLCCTLHEWTISCLMNFKCALGDSIKDAEICIHLALLTNQTSLKYLCERIASCSYKSMKISLNGDGKSDELLGDSNDREFLIKNEKINIKNLGVISQSLLEDFDLETSCYLDLTKQFLTNLRIELFTHFIADTQRLLLNSSELISELDDQFDHSNKNNSVSPISHFGFISGSCESLILMLYEEVKKLYSKIQSVIPAHSVPNLRPQVWFFPFVSKWIERQRVMFLSGRIQRAINEDDWSPVGESLCSSSLIDLFSMLYRLAERFKCLPYSSAQAIEFAQLVSRIVQDYSRKIGLLLNESLKSENLREMWGWTQSNADYEIHLPIKILSCLNNLQSCWKYLIELIVHIDFEDTYEKGLRDVDDEKETFESINFLELKWDMETPKIPSEFQCDTAFDEINRLVFQAESGFAYGMSKFWISCIHMMVEQSSSAIEPITYDSTKTILGPALNDLYAKLAYLENTVYGKIDAIGNSISRIFHFCISVIAQEFEKLLLADSSRKVMTETQLQSIEYGLLAFIQSLREFNFPEKLLTSINCILRVQTIIKILRHDSSQLRDIWLSLDENMYSPSEDIRSCTPPYIGRNHLTKVLKFRALQRNDPHATEFIKTYYKSKNPIKNAIPIMKLLY